MFPSCYQVEHGMAVSDEYIFWYKGKQGRFWLTPRGKFFGQLGHDNLIMGDDIREVHRDLYHQARVWSDER